MDLSEYLRLFRERWLAIALCLVLGIGTGIIVTAAMPHTYTATASLFVKPESSAASLYERSQFATQQAKSYPALVDSPNVLNPVIFDLSLKESPQQLAKRISADNPIETATVTVSAEAETADSAATLANAVARSLSREVGKVELVPATKNTPKTSVNLQLTTPATPPLSAVSPKPLVNLAIGALGGLAVGLVLAILLALSDRTVRSERDVRRVASLPLIAELPRRAASSRRPHGASPYEEVLSNVQLIANGRLPQIIALTPADRAGIPGDLRQRMAESSASLGYRSCLVEADASATLPQSVALDGPGLAGVLAGTASVREAVTALEGSTVMILPAGEPSAAPVPVPEEVAANAFGELRALFDTVIVQSVPLARPLELRAAAQSADAVIVLARFGKTHVDDVARRVAQLGVLGIRPLGVILTGVPRSRRSVVIRRWTHADLVNVTRDASRTGTRSSGAAGQRAALHSAPTADVHA